MKRITVDQVRLAYEQTGKKPMNMEDSSGDYCCPAVAVGLATGLKNYPGLFDYLWSTYGRAYVDGFVNGVDGDWKEADPTPDWERGYEDGEAVRVALGLRARDD